MTKRKSFSPEFKREAVRLMERSRKPAADLARELGRPRKHGLVHGLRDIVVD